MSAEYADGFARLNQQRFIISELLQLRQDFVETLPVSRGAADAAIDDQSLRIFRNLGIEIVLNHPVCRFGEPATARDFRASGSANYSAGGNARVCGQEFRHGPAPSSEPREINHWSAEGRSTREHAVYNQARATASRLRRARGVFRRARTRLHERRRK